MRLRKAWSSVERDDDDLLGAGAPEGADRLATLLGLTLWKDDEGEGHTLSLPVARALLDGWHNFKWGRDRATGPTALPRTTRRARASTRSAQTSRRCQTLQA